MLLIARRATTPAPVATRAGAAIADRGNNECRSPAVAYAVAECWRIESCIRLTDVCRAEDGTAILPGVRMTTSPAPAWAVIGYHSVPQRTEVFGPPCIGSIMPDQRLNVTAEIETVGGLTRRYACSIDEANVRNGMRVRSKLLMRGLASLPSTTIGLSRGGPENLGGDI